MAHNDKNHSLTIQLDNLTRAQSLAIEDMLAQWQALAQMGSSRYVAFFADGDGNFHPSIAVNSGDSFRHPEFYGSPEMILRRWKKDVYFIDFDEIAWRLREEEEERNPPLKANALIAEAQFLVRHSSSSIRPGLLTSAHDVPPSDDPQRGDDRDNGHGLASDDKLLTKRDAIGNEETSETLVHEHTEEGNSETES